MSAIRYPATFEGEHADIYHGVRVLDPFRWLENGDDPEVTAWIAAQNAVTKEHIAGLPGRGALEERLVELVQYERWYSLYRRGPYLLYKRNSGLGVQPMLYAQVGLAGTPAIVVDPREWNSDGTTRIVSFSLSADCRFLAYALSHAGSDWQEVRIKEIATGRQLPDCVRMNGPPPAWHGHGFYYSTYGESATNGAPARLAASEGQQVRYHHIGQPQSADTLIYADSAHPHWLHFVQTTGDEQAVVLSIANYGEPTIGSSLLTLDTALGEPQWTQVVAGFDGVFHIVESRTGALVCLTTRGAPNGRVVEIDLSRPQEVCWRTLLDEQEHPLDQVVAAGGKFFAVCRRGDAPQVHVLDQHGRFEQELALPGPGLVQLVPGERSDQELLWSFASFTEPVTVYRYDLVQRQSVPFLKSTVSFNPRDYQTTRVFYPAKDGARIPMYLVHRAGLRLDSRNPLLLHGYGGNGISVGPTFDPLLLALLERGVVYAVPCLRGGGEYGETWHDAGRREHKQTVFDDCIAAAEWLYAHSYSSADRTAIMGASNGGLLVGALITQRPELFAVAIPAFGILDMLRFHLFTQGPSWTSEYGSSDDPSLFPGLLAYSPLHNVRTGVRYPATLVLTSEDDDRVVPSHSFKFVATLQAKGAGPGPYLIRIDRDSGHGAISLPKEIEQRADLYAFLLSHLPGCGNPPSMT